MYDILTPRKVVNFGGGECKWIIDADGSLKYIPHYPSDRDGRAIHMQIIPRPHASSRPSASVECNSIQIAQCQSYDHWPVSEQDHM